MTRTHHEKNTTRKHSNQDDRETARTRERALLDLILVYTRTHTDSVKQESSRKWGPPLEKEATQ